VKRGEPLLVPTFLIERVNIPDCRQLCRFAFNTKIRPLSAMPTQGGNIDLTDKSTATAVLPDHFYTGQWKSFREAFDLDTRFLLASDGFYSAFKSPSDIWHWLKAHENRLSNDPSRESLMQDLHRRRDDSGSDDDISLIWIFPDGPPSLFSEKVASHGSKER
jgi:hypothetical protein